MPQKKDVLRNKHQKKRQAKALYKYQQDDFGPADKTKLAKHRNVLIDGILKEDLQQEFEENRDIKIKKPNKNE